ncbi:MAG: Flp1 family type IVb pilin [Bdellovibrionales bacterium]
MKKAISAVKKFWNDESGQGGTEYVLLLVVVVALVGIFRNQIKEAFSAKLGDLSSSIQGFTGDGQ